MAAHGPGPINGDAVFDLNPRQTAEIAGLNPDTVPHFGQLPAEIGGKLTAPAAQGRKLIVKDQNSQRAASQEFCSMSQPFFPPQFKDQQGPEQFAMILTPGHMFCQQSLYILRIE